MLWVIIILKVVTNMEIKQYTNKDFEKLLTRNRERLTKDLIHALSDMTRSSFNLNVQMGLLVTDINIILTVRYGNESKCISYPYPENKTYKKYLLSRKPFLKYKEVYQDIERVILSRVYSDIIFSGYEPV